MILSNKAKYIKEVLDGTIDLRRKKKQEIINMLQEKEYDTIDDDTEAFNYLLRMPMDSVSEEKVDKLLKELQDNEVELVRVKNTTIQQMWLAELDILENEYQEYQKEREQSQTCSDKKSKKNAVTKIVGGAKKVVKKASQVELVEEEIIIEPKKKSVKKSNI